MATPLRVLMIENSEDDALLIADCLAQAGYTPDWRQVETPAQMAEALAPPNVWDLILSDYLMPEFSGLRALALYKQSGLDIPFLLISGSIGEERAVEAVRAGAHDYIMKDRMQRLGPAVDRELREAANRREHRQALSVDLPVRRLADTTPPETDFSQFITEVVERAAALIDGLLTNANMRPPADRSVTTEAGAVARQALSNLAASVEKLSALL